MDFYVWLILITDSCDGMLPTIPMTMGSSEPLVDGVQPLTSNIVNKQPSAMDAQYMQQQSQVFVFSTTLANKAAEAVIKGQFKSIIAYHCAQPKTKKYLEVIIPVYIILESVFILRLYSLIYDQLF